MLEQLRQSFESIKSQADSLSDRVLSLESATSHSHFKALQARSDCIASWSLRDDSHYTTVSRGLLSPLRKYAGANPGVKYDPNIDAARVSLPPLTNELGPDGNGGSSVGQFACSWGVTDWQIGSKLVVQFEMLISQAMKDLVPTPGLNGRKVGGFKFVNLCRPAGAVTYELRTNFVKDPVDTLLDVRGYGSGLGPCTLEGVVGRDQFAAPLGGNAFDSHPGPGSFAPSNGNPPHSTQFRFRSHKWVRVTYEMERTAEGQRLKLWLADEDTSPALVIASPTDSSKGFLTSVADPIACWFCQLDSSQETTYATPMPERWCAFRNLVVLSNVSGESVLGGRPK